MNRVLVNGVADIGIPGDDPGLLLGLTVFDTMRTYGHAGFRFSQHLDRLEASAARFRIPCPERSLIESEIAANLGENCSVRYMLTAGGNRVLQVKPIDESRIGAPVRVARMDWNPPSWLPGVVKHGSRAAWMVGAQNLGVDEVILVDNGGFILEANRSNVFAVVDGTLVTPPLDGRFLPGVTRSALIEASEKAGLPLEERPLPYDAPFDELYVSSTMKELAPVVGVDERPGPGNGPLGGRLLEAFRELISLETGVDYA